MALFLTEQSKVQLEKIQNFAEKTDRSFDEVLQVLADRLEEVFFEEDSQIPQGTPGSQLLKMIEMVDFASDEEDVSENSREILRTEFTDHLLNRMNDE